MMARCNINKYLEPNLTVDSVKTRAAREDVLASVSPASGMVQSGQRIIDRGEIISPTSLKFCNRTKRKLCAVTTVPKACGASSSDR